MTRRELFGLALSGFIGRSRQFKFIEASPYRMNGRTVHAFASSQGRLWAYREDGSWHLLQGYSDAMTDIQRAEISLCPVKLRK